MTGFGIFAIFVQLLNYLIDAYLIFAASAIAGNTFMRSIFGAIFPLFATYMFDGMGIQYAATLLGCVAAVLVFMPIAFILYGKKIRARSNFAPALDLKHEEKKRAMATGNEEGLDSGDSAEQEKGGKTQ